VASPTLRLGTRGSQLALWQAHAVASRIAETGGPLCEVVVIKTTGDRLQQAPLSEVGGKRLFVKEIEEALLGGDIDLAVHSSKDMPAVLPDGLTIAAVLPREDPLDAIVLPERDRPATGSAGTLLSPVDAFSQTVTEVAGSSPSFGTGSVRRIAQLMRVFPAARFSPIRGNLDTRLRKLDAGDYDALVLAAAGLRRLGFASRISLTVPADVCLPAPGQGIVAIEVRHTDERVKEAVAPIDDPAAGAALRAERAVVEALGGGCQTPIGALALQGPGGLELSGVVVSLDGSRVVRGRARGALRDADALGARLGAELLAQGAGDILEEARRASGSVEGIQP
jgi:hydroxymethylbilane synthase